MDGTASLFPPLPAGDLVLALGAKVVDLDGPHLLLQTRWEACQEWL